MIRNLIALVGGFAITAFLALALTILAALALGVRGNTPNLPYTMACLTAFFVAAVSGGFAAAALAPGQPFRHAVGVAIMTLLMALSMLHASPPALAPWYPVVLALVGPLGALVGGALHRWRAIGRQQPV